MANEQLLLYLAPIPPFYIKEFPTKKKKFINQIMDHYNTIPIICYVLPLKVRIRKPDCENRHLKNLTFWKESHNVMKMSTLQDLS